MKTRKGWTLLPFPDSHKQSKSLELKVIKYPPSIVVKDKDGIFPILVWKGKDWEILPQ